MVSKRSQKPKRERERCTAKESCHCHPPKVNRGDVEVRVELVESLPDVG
jgi:hypothetical protein